MKRREHQNPCACRVKSYDKAVEWTLGCLLLLRHITAFTTSKSTEKKTLEFIEWFLHIVWIPDQDQPLNSISL